MLRRLATAAALMVISSSASAATIFWQPTPTTGAVANWSILSQTGTYYDNVTGSIGGVRRSPWQGSGLEATAAYDSIARGQVTYDLGGWASGVRLVWGSPDNGNAVDFLRNGTVVDTFLYNTTTAAGFNLANSLGSIYANAPFNQIRMRYTSVAFEFATIGVTSVPAPVPVPASVALLGGALAGIGLMRRRRG